MLILGNDTVIDFPILDADAHVIEPPDTWQPRMPARLRDRAPRVLRMEDGGDAWQFDENKPLRRLGLIAMAGKSYLQFKNAGVPYEEIRPGAWDAKARLADMDLDGVAAQVLYPTVALAGAKTYSDDPELQVACVRAYNQWLAELCAAGAGRLYGLGVIPTVGLDAAIAELRCSLELGHRGVILSRYPSGGLKPVPEDDQFFALAQEAGVALHIHIGSFTPNAGPLPTDGLEYLQLTAANKAGADAIPVVAQFLLSGIFDRFPRLKVVLVEANIGWIPTVLEQIDDIYLRFRFWTNTTSLKRMPSEYFYDNFRSTFLMDVHGVANRHKCGLENIMWSSDYPHSATDWPNSRVILERNFRGVPGAEVKKMVHDNAAALYKIELALTPAP
jgi:predicted TIM-barrel fold metal-dependent hydrolase